MEEREVCLGTCFACVPECKVHQRRKQSAPKPSIAKPASRKPRPTLHRSGRKK